jgi:hypothetical protein
VGLRRAIDAAEALTIRATNHGTSGLCHQFRRGNVNAGST